jgi:hypothetical protein
MAIAHSTPLFKVIKRRFNMKLILQIAVGIWIGFAGMAFASAVFAS